jgi:hypothetical protein
MLSTTTRNTAHVRSARQGRSSSLVPPALPSHMPPPSTVLAARRARLGASPAQHQRLQHLRQPLSTAHATFVASPRVLAILSTMPTFAQSLRRHASRTRGARYAHHARRLPMRCDRLQRRPTICSKPVLSRTTTSALQLAPSPKPLSSRPRPRPPSTASIRPHRSAPLPTHPRSPQHHLRAQRAPRTFPSVCAAPIGSDRCADPFRRLTARHPRLRYAPQRQ